MINIYFIVVRLLVSYIILIVCNTMIRNVSSLSKLFCPKHPYLTNHFVSHFVNYFFSFFFFVNCTSMHLDHS